MYNGATLDVIVAFSDRPIVFKFKKRGNALTCLFDNLSHVAVTSQHDITAIVFIQFYK